MVSEKAPQVDQNIVENIEALASQQRLEILVALAERKYGAETGSTAMTFTELYNAVDCQSSSQFTYHLNRLIETFIVETPEGYRLTYAGDKVRRAIFSGLYESSQGLQPMDIEGTCPVCGSQSLTACSTNARFTVECTACETSLLSDFFPQSVARDRTPREVVDSFGYSIWAKFVFVRGGVCPECYGRVETEIQRSEEGDRSFIVSVSECRECLFTVHVPVDVAVAFHPVVVEAFWQHGISLLDTPLWELFEYTTADFWEATIASEDPFTLNVDIFLDNRELRLFVDETLTVSLLEGDK